MCGQCHNSFDSLVECQDHVDSHLFKCYKCKFEAEDLKDIKRHERQEHSLLNCESEPHEGECKKYYTSKEPVEKFTCSLCDQTCENNEQLKHHLSSHKQSQNSPLDQSLPQTQVNCDQCNFVATDVPNLVNHIITSHKQTMKMCDFCEHEAASRDLLKAHIMEKHENQFFLNVIADQMVRVKDSFDMFEVFKVELKDILNKLIDGHNSVKQELFLIRNNQVNDTRLKDIENSIKRLSSRIGTSPSPATEDTQVPSVSSPSPPVNPSALPTTTASPAANKSRKRLSRKQPPLTPAAEPKILFIGDSVSRNVDLKAITDATRSTIVTARAYNAVHDDVANIAKDAAFYPRKNFSAVVPTEVVKDEFDHLILQAGSVDITNLKTKENANSHLDYFRQQAVFSAKNIFKSGVDALTHQPSLKKVIIMKQIPRYDPKNVDPLSLKPALSQLLQNKDHLFQNNFNSTNLFHITSG